MKVYVVNKKDYQTYRQGECEKIQKKVDFVSEDQVVTNVVFSTRGKDFSMVDSALYKILIEQYHNNKYITQNDLDMIEKALQNIEDKDIELLSNIISAYYEEIGTTDDIVNYIKGIDNYIFLYLTDEKSIGYFIVKNIDEYKISEGVLDKMMEHIDFRSVAKEYLGGHNLKVAQIEDVLLDISENKEDELIQKLREQEKDSSTIYAKEHECKDSQESEEDFELGGDE